MNAKALTRCTSGLKVMSLATSLGLLGMVGISDAKEVRHCSAAYTLHFKTSAQGEIAHIARMESFKTTSRCSAKSAALICRKMARGRAHACMSAHWKIRQEEPPAACTGRLKDYPSGALMNRLTDFVCNHSRAQGHGTIFVDLMASTFGAHQCMGDALLAADLRFDCSTNEAKLK